MEFFSSRITLYKKTQFNSKDGYLGIAQSVINQNEKNEYLFEK